MPDATLTLRDLIERTGVNPVTLRSWVRHAVMPHGHGRARGTRYTEDYVFRILAVQALRAKGFSLAQVAHRVRLMTDEELAAFAKPVPAPAPTALPAPAPTALPAPASPASPADLSYPHRPLHWVPLIPGLTLLVDSDCGDLVKRLAHEIVERYAVRAEPPAQASST